MVSFDFVCILIAYFSFVLEIYEELGLGDYLSQVAAVPCHIVEEEKRKVFNLKDEYQVKNF
jgi:hypothetical protein